MEKIKIGKITSPVGLKGEVKIVSYSDDPERFEKLDSVCVQMRKYQNTVAEAGAKSDGYKEPEVWSCSWMQQIFPNWNKDSIM